MAINLFFESRGESVVGRQWVLHVVNNRIDSEDFKSTVCSVVKERKAFEWYYHLKYLLPQNELLWPMWVINNFNEYPIELDALRVSFIESFYFYRNTPKDITKGSIYFVTKEFFLSDIFDCLVEEYTVSGVVDNHIFFNYIKWKKYKSCNNRSRLYVLE